MALPQYTPKPEKNPIEQEADRILETVKDIPLRIGVHAGKGGVGKTFLATQIALTLAKTRKVGLIDADVDCPNIPEALGIQEDILVNDEGKLEPVLHENIQVVSTGYMQTGDAIIIRGPIKHRLLTDFIEKTAWNNPEALVFDFPPGTSDVPLSAMQVANLTGIILVTTPTIGSLKDCARAKAMADRHNIPVLGVIANMTGDIFGSAQGIEAQLGAPVIAEVQLDQKYALNRGELVLPQNVQKKLLESFEFK